jgi:hypothetical protein
MKIAVFTIAKNEKYFLPIWMKYYSQFFKKEDIYIIDNGSTDGCMVGPDVECIWMPSQYDFDVKFLNDVAMTFQKQLLERYDAVLFAEADEIVVPKKKGRFDLHLKDKPTARCLGYEVVHVVEKEPPIDWNMPLLHQRQYWELRPDFCKPLLSKIPLAWEVGFHDSIPPVAIDRELALIHLRRIDYEHSKQRLLKRSAWPRPPQQAENMAWQWKLASRDFDFWFKETYPNLIHIPEEFRNVC